MDIFIHHEALSHGLLQYGGVVLFVLLVLGIIILPVPEETLMVLAGVLMSKGKLNIPSTLLFAYAGSICGISLSYLLGRTAGHYLINKFGSRLGITEEHLNKVHQWFERFGKWTLIIGYFIPGVRHFTGFVSGTSYMHFKLFALFAYSGAILWVTTFLSIGYFSSPFFFSLVENIKADWDEKIAILILLIGLIYILYLKLKAKHDFKIK